MTTKQTAPGLWPEKVWLDTIHWNDQSKPPRFFGAQNSIVHVVEPVNSIGYIRADLSPPSLTQEELRQVLEALALGEDFGMQSFARTFGVVSNLNMDKVKKIRAAIAILKGHLNRQVQK